MTLKPKYEAQSARARSHLIVSVSCFCADPSGGVQKTQTVADCGDVSRRRNVKRIDSPGATESMASAGNSSHLSSTPAGPPRYTLYAYSPLTFFTSQTWSELGSLMASNSQGRWTSAADSARATWRSSASAARLCSATDRSAAAAADWEAASAACSYPFASSRADCASRTPRHAMIAAITVATKIPRLMMIVATSMLRTLSTAVVA